jgi:hypothetical protein
MNTANKRTLNTTMHMNSSHVTMLCSQTSYKWVNPILNHTLTTWTCSKNVQLTRHIRNWVINKNKTKESVGHKFSDILSMASLKILTLPFHFPKGHSLFLSTPRNLSCFCFLHQFLIFCIWRLKQEKRSLHKSTGFSIFLFDLITDCFTFIFVFLWYCFSYSICCFNTPRWLCYVNCVRNIENSP